MNKGRKLQGQQVHDNLKALAGNFKTNPQAIIMTPIMNKLNDNYRYPTYLPGVKIQTETYHSPDDGVYTEGDMKDIVPNAARRPVGKKRAPAGVKLGKGELYYKELVYDQDVTNGDGFTVFQYNINQGIRIIQEQRILKQQTITAEDK
jgi:hypothetical protein